MNPFNLNERYDDTLASLICQVNKSSALNLNDSLNELLQYLPHCSLHSDYQIIVMTLKPLVSSPAKRIVNKIFYFLAKKLGSYSLKDVQFEWLYENFESPDPYALKLIEKYLEIEDFADEFVKSLKWSDQLKDLHFFEFLFERTQTNLYFDVSHIPFATYLELDLIFNILKVFKSKYPIELMKIVNDKGPIENIEGSVQMVKEIFTRIKLIGSPLLISKKQKILIEIFNYIDSSIYNEVCSLDNEVFNKLIQKDIEFEKLKLCSVDQILSVVHKLKDPMQFIINNIENQICVFELFEKYRLPEDFTSRYCNLIENAVNDSMKRHFTLKNCKNHEYTNPGEINTDALAFFYQAMGDKYKIIAASKLKKSLTPENFDFKDIEQSMEHAVNVFPLDFFTKNQFNTSSYYILKKNPELLSDLIKNNKIENFIISYPKTKPDHIVRLITDIELLKIYLEGHSIETIKRLSKINTIPKLKIVYLYFARDEVEQIDVDYSIVFEHFFFQGFVRYLLSTKNNIPNFIQNSVEYIKNMPFKNSVFNTGWEYDCNSYFYYNLGLPNRDRVLLILRQILQSITLCPILQVLKHVLDLMLYYDVFISDELKLRLEDNSFIEEIKKNFNLGDKNFFLNRFLDEFVIKKDYLVETSMLYVNYNKTRDVLLRNLFIPKEYLLNLTPDFLSNLSLKAVISTILESKFGKDGDRKMIRLNKQHHLHLTEPINGSIKNNEKLSMSNTNTAYSQKSDNIDILINTTKDALNLNPDIYQSLVSEFFTESKVENIVDFCYLFEKDSILNDSNFREDRLEILKPLLNLIGKHLSETVLNLYSIAKLETSSNNDVVFEMLFSPIKKYKNAFWLIVSSALSHINNIYICAFIEEMLTKYTTTKNDNFLISNHIKPLELYLREATDYEGLLFSLAFPNISASWKIRCKASIENYVKSLTSVKIDGGKLTFSKTNEYFKLKFVYRVDSVVHEATISVPVDFPFKKARIDFETNRKNLKFFHKINELLGKTSKFVEIFFIWKVDIDNFLIGYNECLICYFIMDPKTKQLPKFKCNVCNNAFHDKCIYKWAAESKNSRCPFCRSELPLWEKGG